jgi:hypothetical protein
MWTLSPIDKRPLHPASRPASACSNRPKRQGIFKFYLFCKNADQYVAKGWLQEMAEGINTEKYFKAKQELNRFLQEHPELLPLQQQIDGMLQKIGNNPLNRNVALQSMMIEMVRKLQSAFQDIKECTEHQGRFTLHSVKDEKDPV